MWLLAILHRKIPVLGRISGRSLDIWDCWTLYRNATAVFADADSSWRLLGDVRHASEEWEQKSGIPAQISNGQCPSFHRDHPGSLKETSFGCFEKYPSPSSSKWNDLPHLVGSKKKWEENLALWPLLHLSTTELQLIYWTYFHILYF